MTRHKSPGLSALRLVALLLALSPGASAAQSQAPPALLRPTGPVVVRAATAALLLSDQEGGAIRLSVLPVPHPATVVAAGQARSGDPPTVTVLVEIEGSSLIADHAQPILRVHAFVYIVGGQREILALATHGMRIDLARHRSLLNASGLRWLVPLAPPPGNHRVRVYLRSEAGTFGLASAPIEIPDPASAAPQLWPTLLPPPPNRWLTVVSEEDQTTLSQAWGWLGSGHVFPVSTRPVLRAESHQPLVVVQSFKSATSDAPRPRVRLEKVDGALQETELASLITIDQVPDGLVAWRGSLGVPPLEGGRYRLAAQLGDLLSPSIPAFGVAGEHIVDTWPKVDENLLAPHIELPTTTAGQDDLSGPMPDQEIIAGYLQALRELITNGQDMALRRLYKLETRVLNLLDNNRALEKLEALEAETLSALLSGHESAFLPVILLHAQAVRGYRAAGRSALVGHSEHLVLRLVRTWVERTSGEPVHRDAIRVLADLAAELRRLGTVAKAVRVYQQALTIEPGNSDIALALAAIQEKRGLPAEAVSVLEALADSHLTGEARLRLAINQQRLGQRAKAEKHLRRLIQGSGNDWIRLLAYEELARIALRRGNFASATQLLRSALRRWPEHRGLRVLQAYALDRTGHSEEAGRLIEEVASRGSSAHMAERFRYNEWPRAELEDGRQDMEQRAMNLLPELRSALEALQQGKPAR